jgi:hypothetical protein
MPTFNIPRVKTVPSAPRHNMLIDAVRSLNSRTSAGGMEGANFSGGPSIMVPAEDEVLGIITGPAASGGGYSWSWAAFQSGSFSPFAPGISNAYEINGRTGVPEGHATVLYPGAAGEKIFQWLRLGTPPPPSGCNVSICITGCTQSLSGTPVTVTDSGGNVVASCTTTSIGCCTVSIPATGTYTVTPGGPLSPGGGLHRLTCGTTIFIDLGQNPDPTNPNPPPPNFVCCDGVMPSTMTLNDANGSYPFTLQPGSSPPTWNASTVIETPSLAPQPSPDGCGCPEAGSGPLTILYTGTCSTTTPFTFTVIRQWEIGACVLDIGTESCDPPIFYLLDGATCTNGPFGTCAAHDLANLTQAPSSVAPFMWSGTLGRTISNSTPDPVGGTVTVTA